MAVVLLAGLIMPAQAQSGPSDVGGTDLAPVIIADNEHERGVSLKLLPRNLAQDQVALFGTPFRMRERQWKLTVPLTILGVGLVATDTAVEGHVSTTPSTVSRATSLSNYGVAALAGVSGGMYLWGKVAKSEHARETGFLSGEAAIDAFLDTTLIKYIAGRDRPFTGNSRGEFFQGGSSFPSQHAAVSWAVASVIAHEYPGPVTKILTYGVAGGVSAARIEGHNHFLSDAVIGSAIGWYLGKQVYRARSSQAEINPRTWGKFVKYPGEEEARATGEMGSTFVPLDSWVYAAFDRLTALGYTNAGSASLRPWTRLECARKLADAHERERDYLLAAELLAPLDREFAQETELIEGGKNRGAQVESVYARVTGISGTPLRDAFHFGQTLINDYGRPYGEGANAIAGVSMRAETGPLAFYVRGEYQYASSIAAYDPAAQQAIAVADSLPITAAPVFGTTNRFRPIEAYVALNFSDWQLSVGQQSLWWGPGRSTGLILSNNAEAMPMVRFTRVSALKVPLLGAIRADTFISRVGGHRFVRLGPTFILTGTPGRSLEKQPYIWGANVSFSPTENLEFGMGLTSMIAGLGRPLNLKTWLHSFSNAGNNQPIDPGDRRTEFNFSYRIPGLRDWVTLYAEGFAEDQPLPLLYPRSSAMNPGIYLAKVPGLPKLDLRVEGVYTNPPNIHNPAFFYFNAHYAEGYRNYGQIIGSWIGRQGSGGQATSTYWFSGQNRMAASYRRVVVDKSFLQGGQMDDFSGTVGWMVRPGVEVSAMTQYERWKFPLLATGAQSNIAASVQIRVFPKLRAGVLP